MSSSSAFFPTDYTLAARPPTHLGPPSPISPAAGCSLTSTALPPPRPSFFRRQSSSTTARAEDSPLTPLASAHQPSTGPSTGYFSGAGAAHPPPYASLSSSPTMSRPPTSPNGENHDPAHLKSTSPLAASKDRRQRHPAPPPIKIAPPRQSTFVFPPSPTEDEDEASPPSSSRRRPSAALSLPTAHDLHYTIPPSPTPPVSPKAYEDELPVVARPRPQSSHSSLRQARKASLVDGQLFGAYCGESLGSSPLSSPAFEGAPAVPRRMSVAGSGTRRRSSMGHGHPGSTGYASFEACINGALAHEKKASSYEDSAQGASPKAHHHFKRSHELLVLAIEKRPGNLEASIYKAGISLTLARRFLQPAEALRQTQTALAELRLAMTLDQTVHSRNLQIACQVQLASLTMLLAKLSEGLHLSMVPRAIWQGEVGNLAREAVRLGQEVVRAEDAVIRDGYVPETPGCEGSAEPWDEEESEDLVNTRIAERERRGSSICHRRVTEETLVEAYLALGEAAQFAAVLAPDLINSDKYFDIAEGAVEGAYRTARDLRSSSLGPVPTTRMSVSTVGPPPVTSASPLMYQVYLRIGPLKMERLRHTIGVGAQFPLNHALARAVLADMAKVATDLASVSRGRCDEVNQLGLLGAEPFVSRRDAKLLAVQALTQLGDAEFLFAHLLKRVWRRRSSVKTSSIRRATSHESVPASVAASATRRSSTDATGPTAAIGSPAAPRRISLDDRRRTSANAGRESLVDKHTIVEEESEEEADAQSCTASSSPKDGGSSNGDHLTSSLQPPAAFSPGFPRQPLASPIGPRPSWVSQSSESAGSGTISPRMSMAQYRRISAASSLRSAQSEEDMNGAMTGILSCSLADRRRSSTKSHQASTPSADETSFHSLIGAQQPSKEDLAEHAWILLASSMRNYKDAFSLLKTSRSATGSTASAQSASSLALQRATLLLSVSMAAYFRASLAPRVAVAKDSRTALLVSAEVYSTWAAREVGWEWLVEDQPRPADFTTPFAGDTTLIVSRHAVIGQKAIFTLLRTVWHRAVSGGPGEVTKEDKRAAKARVEAIVLRLKDEAGCTAYDITRFKVGVEKFEGEFDQGESLFWGGLSRTLKGSA